MTGEGGGGTEKPISAAVERALDIPPKRLRGFFPTQVVSLPIDIPVSCFGDLKSTGLAHSVPRDAPCKYFRSIVETGEQIEQSELNLSILNLQNKKLECRWEATRLGSGRNP
ncbi:hypothetical protein U1Q18_018746 [Sarracenia purpurea var. burkii]